MTAGLTKRQTELLSFVKDRLEQGLPSPSYMEMAGHLRLSSLSGINRLVKGLEARGFIRRLAGCPRSIAVVRQGAKPGTIPVDLPAFTYRLAEARAGEMGLPVSELVASFVLDGVRVGGRP